MEPSIFRSGLVRTENTGFFKPAASAGRPRTLSRARLIGSRWELIGGSLSLLVGGTTTDESGRRVRFLQISVGAEPQDYSITIVVPFKSDPEEVLPLVEEIVSSFDTIW